MAVYKLLGTEAEPQRKWRIEIH